MTEADNGGNMEKDSPDAPNGQYQRPTDYWCNDDAQVKIIEDALDLYERQFASSEKGTIPVNPACRATCKSPEGWSCDCEYGHPLLCAKAAASPAATPRTEAHLKMVSERLGSDYRAWVEVDFARTLERENADLRKQLAAKQAELDRLMIEYCPDEMTEAQLAEWAKHQKPVKESPSATEAIGPGDGISAGKFHCACVFSRASDFSEATLVSACAYHAKSLPVEETAIGHARYEYIRTLNPRQFAAMYDEALHGDRFDDLVDRYRMKGGV